MNGLWPGDGFTRGYERIVLSALQLVIMVLVVIAVVDLFYLLFNHAVARFEAISTVQELQEVLQKGFAGVLLVLIGLELLETLRAYQHDHHVRLEVVIVVAVIAVGRHIIQLDLEHMTGSNLIGIAALMLALTGGYVLVRRFAAMRHQASKHSLHDPEHMESPP